MFTNWILAVLLAVVVALTAASPRPGYGSHGHVSYGHQIHHGGYGHGGHGGYGHGGHGGYGHGGHGHGGSGKSFVFFKQHFSGHHGYH